jgi:hypothetical protein
MRADGRRRDDFRSMTLELGVLPQARARARAQRQLPRALTCVCVGCSSLARSCVCALSRQASGSARLRLGGTEVVVGVRADVEACSPDAVGASGRVEVVVEIADGGAGVTGGDRYASEARARAPPACRNTAGQTTRTRRAQQQRLLRGCFT